MDKSQEESLKQLRCYIKKGMSYQNGSLLIISIANVLADGLDSNEINALGSFIQSVGQIMSYIASQKDLNK